MVHRAKNGQTFEFFAIVKNRFGEISIISGTIIARENPKTAFERVLNSPSLGFRQISHKVNGLASRGH